MADGSEIASNLGQSLSSSSGIRIVDCCPVKGEAWSRFWFIRGIFLSVACIFRMDCTQREFECPSMVGANADHYWRPTNDPAILTIGRNAKQSRAEE
jgi:hypothetical protein